MITWLSLVLVASLAVLALAVSLSSRAFDRKCADLVAGLTGDEIRTKPSVESLPEAVRVFAERAVAGHPSPRRIRLRQRCEMRFKPGGPWQPMDAEQVIAIRRPGFVWQTQAELAPLVTAKVVDAFVRGRGLLEVRLLGLIPVARFAGPEADRSELMRYLAELPWAPHALLFNPELDWQQLAPDVVEVSAESSGGRAVVRLVFENGDIARVEADDRPRAEGKLMVGRRWSGRFWDYREVGGMRVPARAEVSWELDEGPFAYWRGEVVELEMEG